MERHVCWRRVGVVINSARSPFGSALKVEDGPDFRGTQGSKRKRTKVA